MSNTASAVIEMELPDAPSMQYSKVRDCAASGPINILLAEDNPSDAMLTEMELNAANIDYDLRTVDSGEDILRYLYRQGKYKDEHKPDMLLLDLSLPHKDGFEVLAEMAVNAERFGELPVVIMTGDQHSAFLKHSYELNIAAYIIKPCTAVKLQKAFAAVKNHHK